MRISPHIATGVICLAMILWGLLFVEDLNLSPSSGLGYALGITGLTSMAVLLLYSVRKRMRLLRNAGPMRTWFEAHLMLGLLGPTAVLYHCGFELGSTNANISLLCVLLVSGSGVGGRFLYGRMHRSLAGERRTAPAYLKAATSELGPIAGLLEAAPDSRKRLTQFAANPVLTSGLFSLTRHAIHKRIASRRLRHSVLAEISRESGSATSRRETALALDQYSRFVTRAADLQLFERLFSLWHAIHVPLTVLLFISAGIHVIAVHLY